MLFSDFKWQLDAPKQNAAPRPWLRCLYPSHFPASKVTTKEGFDLVPYMGKWYELEKYPNSFQEGDCGVARYKLQDDATISVNNTQRKPDGSADTAIGQVTTVNFLSRL